jgi:hypothetical protein
MYDLYRSRRKPPYELVIPRGTNLETYDRWDGDWQRIRTTENPGQKEREGVANLGHYLGRETDPSKRSIHWTERRRGSGDEAEGDVVMG